MECDFKRRKVYTFGQVWEIVSSLLIAAQMLQPCHWLSKLCIPYFNKTHFNAINLFVLFILVFMYLDAVIGALRIGKY